MLAAVLSAIGLGLWGYAVATRPSGVRAPDSTGAAGLVASGVETKPEPRLVDRAGPVMSKFGLSFLAGFGLGFASRKFLRWTLLLAAIAGAGLYAAHRMGWINLSSSDIERHVSEGVQMAQGQAGKVKDFVSGYLPSAAAGAVGAFIGFRRG